MAFLRHSGIYFLARIITGGASFALIAVYTRLLSPQQFGELALALSGVAFIALLIADAPTLALLRYRPENSAAARATILWGVILPGSAICAVMLLVMPIVAPPRWRIELALCAGLLLATLLHRYQLATVQSALQPGRYTVFASLEGALEMLLGIGLVWLGYGVAGALIGAMTAVFMVAALNWRGWWIGRQHFDAVLARRMLRFGLPLTLSALFIWLATFVDRWLLAAVFGVDSAGLYAAAYDLQMNLLGVPLAVMQLAGYPLAMSALTERGTQAAQVQLRQLGTFIILIVLPAAIGTIMAAPLLTAIFLGAAFGPLTLSLIPILVGATFFKVLMTYANYGYLLGSRTNLTLLSTATAAAVNFGANLILIPLFGAWGAASASLVGFVAGFAVAVVKMRRVFAFPLPDPALVAAGLVGVAVMAGWLYPFYQVTAWTSATYVIPVAVLVYFASALLLLLAIGRKPIDLIRGMWNAEAGIS